MNTEIGLSKIECTIIFDAQMIRRNIQKAVNPDSSTDDVFSSLPMEQSLRIVLTDLNILHCASVENTKAIKRLIVSVTDCTSKTDHNNYNSLIPIKKFVITGDWSSCHIIQCSVIKISTG